MMRTLLALLLLAVVASASVPRIRVSPSPLTRRQIEKGSRLVYRVELLEPIICPSSSQQECAVTIRLTNTHPHKIAVDNCLLKWRANQWHVARNIIVTAVENFVDDREEDLAIITEVAESPSIFYNGFNADDILLRTMPRPSAVCSGTGDPHYSTFDGFYYHVRPAGRTVFYKSTAVNRMFEVQTDMYVFNGRPAVHCGLAVREENDVVVVSLCGDGRTIQYRRTCGSSTCRAGGSPRVGITSGNHPRYVIDFASGAQVTVSVHFWDAIQRLYMNIYVTAPGKDYNAVHGMCGNNNGNRFDDVPVGWDQWINDLSVLVQDGVNNRGNRHYFIPSYDLFAWSPSTTEPAPPTLPPFAELCPVVDKEVIRPILNHPDTEDITQLIRDARPRPEDNRPGMEFHDLEGMPEPLGREQAEALCRQVVESNVAQACLRVFPNFDLEEYNASCIWDAKETGDPDQFLIDAIDALEDRCADNGNRDLDTWRHDEDGRPIEPNLDLQDTLCPNRCSGHGTCQHTRCQCQAPWQGVDCSVNTQAVPTVTGITNPLCDSRHINDCPEMISVRGTNFWNSPNLKCRFDGQHETVGHFVGSMEILCEVPLRISHKGGQQLVESVQITMDGQVWSTVSSRSNFAWYDSVCQVCTSPLECVPNPESCFIGGECHIHMEVDPSNVCRHCEPQLSPTAWSFTEDHHDECMPAFERSSFFGRIVTRGRIGDLVATVKASNSLTAADPLAAVKYSLRVNSNNGRSDIFRIDETTGEVRLKADIDVTPARIMSWDALMHVIATDGYGRMAEANLFVELLETNPGPEFDRVEYQFSIDENVPVGTRVGSLAAVVSETFGTIEYVWIQQQQNHPDAFLLIRQSGEITVGVSPDFESLARYELVALARDGTGSARAVDVKININDVNEAPTDVRLSSSQVKETAAVGTVIGTLSAVDPDAGNTHTFQLIDTDGGKVALSNGNELHVAAPLDSRTFSSISVVVRATDQGGLFFEKTLVVTIERVNRAPHSIALRETTFSSASSGVLTELTVQDDDENDEVRCVLSEDADGRFVLDNNTPQRLILQIPFERNKPATFTIEVGCMDLANALATQQFTLAVSNTQGPMSVMFAQHDDVPEDAQGGVTVGVVEARDYNLAAQSMTFELEGPSAQHFQLSQPACDRNTTVYRCAVQVTVKNGAQFDYETEPVVIMSVRVDDHVGTPTYADFEVRISDVNEAPSGLVWLNGLNTVQERAAPGTVVGQLLVVDDDANDRFSFELRQGGDIFDLQVVPDDRRRTVMGRAATVLVRDGQLLNAALNPVVTLEVAVTDEGGLTAVLTAEVNVLDEPWEIVFADTNSEFVLVSEHTQVGQVIGMLEVSGLDTGVEATFTLKVPSDKFKIENNQVILIAPLDYEQQVGHVLTVEVTFSDGTPSIVQNIYIQVKNEDDAPYFVDPPSVLVVSHDQVRGWTLVELRAVDPEGAHVTLTLESSELPVLELTANGQLRLTAMPSSQGIAVGDYAVQVRAASASTTDEDTILTITVRLVDDCHGDPCGGNGQCTDVGIFAFQCDCVPGRTGPRCEQIMLMFSSKSQDNNAAGLAAGVTVGALCLIVLIAVLILVVVRRRRQQQVQKEALAWSHAEQGVFDNPTFVAPSYDEPMYASAGDFVPGVSNPMYEWYRPDLSRQDATESLLSSGEGAFIVRDSKATPGWHMLGVRTQDAVVHEKIRMNEDGMYELLPTSNRPQPQFASLPELVRFYGETRPGMSYVLAVGSIDNPMYAMGAQEATHYQTNWRRDAEAPAVPIKERERLVLSSVAAASDEQEIYGNTAEAAKLFRTSSDATA